MNKIMAGAITTFMATAGSIAANLVYDKVKKPKPVCEPFREHDCVITVDAADKTDQVIAYGYIIDESPLKAVDSLLRYAVISGDMTSIDKTDEGLWVHISNACIESICENVNINVTIKNGREALTEDPTTVAISLTSM